MKLHSVDPQPFHRLRYQCAARGGGTERRLLPFLRGRVDRLPAEVEALVVTADLQGVVTSPFHEPYLLGLAVAECLSELAGSQLPDLSRVGVVLAGDLFCVPSADERGGFGDVAEVWNAFALGTRSVIGVAGNHDDVSKLPQRGNQHLLDTRLVELEGLRVGGVGLASGNPRRPGKRDPAEQVEHVGLVASERPDLLILHEGPAGAARDFPGNDAFAELIDPEALVLFGHVHWPAPVDGVHNWLNVCERVVVLTQ